MYIAAEVLIDGAMRTLREVVLPNVGSRYARGQLWAVLDILNNLRDRIEEKAEFFEEELKSAEPVLEQIAAQLAACGREAEAAALRKACSELPAGPPAQRAVEVRAALVQGMEALGRLPESQAAPARAALEAHLVNQALRDVLPLKQSLLQEISKG